MKSLAGVKRTTLDVIRVFRSPGRGTGGRIRAGQFDIPCALGRSGVVRRKREGDGATPVGQAKVLALYYRADRLPRPRTRVPIRRIGPDLGWCDDPRDRRYNQPVRLPISASHERLWRDDALYDVMLDLSFNRRPIRRGGGSALFLHVARPSFAPTEGCIAADPRAVRRLVGMIGRRTRIRIQGGRLPPR